MNIEQFITDLIINLGLQNQESTRKFLRDWIKAESRAKGRPHGFNPLNTTWKLTEDKGMTNFNSNGGNPVKNYSTYSHGLTATLKTLRLSYYKAIINYLKGIQTSPQAVASAIRTWGTIEFANRIFAPKTGNVASKHKPYLLPLITLSILLIIGVIYININYINGGHYA